MRFQHEGWYNGADDCDPPEPGKEWLAITDEGEEIAVIVIRTDASIFENDSERLEAARRWREEKADLIVRALNAYAGGD